MDKYAFLDGPDIANRKALKTDNTYKAPSNIKKHQARQNTSSTPQPIQRVLQAALITGDMAMRNVALRINLK